MDRYALSADLFRLFVVPGRLRLLDALRAAPDGARGADIAASAGLTVHVARRYMTRLRRQGVVEATHRRRHVYYQLTPQGHAVLALLDALEDAP